MEEKVGSKMKHDFNRLGIKSAGYSFRNVQHDKCHFVLIH